MGVKQSAPQNVVFVGHKVFHVQMLILSKHESKRNSVRERDREGDDEEED